MLTVVISEKGGSGQKLDFDVDEISIGRVHGNDIVLPRGNVSKQHAKIFCTETQCTIHDLGSTNGTYLNGRRIKDTAVVGPQDKIYVGEFILQVEGVGTLEEEEASRGNFEGVITSVRTLDDLVPPRPKRRVPAPNNDRSTDEIDARPTLSQPPLSGASETSLEAEEYRGRTTGSPASDFDTALESLLDDLSEQVRRIDLDALPLRADPGTAERVRYVLGALVAKRRQLGRVPVDVETGRLLNQAFLTAIEVGPLNDWLVDPEIRAIRILGHDEIFVLRDGRWETADDFYDSPDDLERALNVLTVGLPGSSQNASAKSCALPDGTAVRCVLPPQAQEQPVAYIRKSALGADGLGPVFAGDLPAAARDLIEEALLTRKNIAVIGGSRTSHLDVVAELVGQIPSQMFVTQLGTLPLPSGRRAKAVRLLGCDSENDSSVVLDRLTELTEEYPADWLVLSGWPRERLASMLASVRGRRGVLVELPFCGDTLVQEMIVSLVAAGTPTSQSVAEEVVLGPFDLFIEVVEGRDGVVSVARLVVPVQTAEGWSLQEKYSDQQGLG